MYTPAERNFEKVQYEAVRKNIDHKYNKLHDELSACYYEGRPFSNGGVDYGVLDKDTFDKLHGLIFEMLQVEFHQENMKPETLNKIPEDQYRYAKDATGKIVADSVAAAQAKISASEKSGLKLVVS